MKTWKRAVQPMPCGGLHDHLTTIPIGAPMLVITMERTRALYRCENCAGESAPAQIAVKSESSGFTQIARPRLIAALPFDFKLAQAGREPGEEG